MKIREKKKAYSLLIQYLFLKTYLMVMVIQTKNDYMCATLQEIIAATTITFWLKYDYCESNVLAL